MSDDYQELQRLLRLKQYERPPEGYFDEFLLEFQSRQRQELLRRSAHSIFFERVGTYFSGFAQVGKAGWIYGGVGAYAAVMIGMSLWSSGPVEPKVGEGMASLTAPDQAGGTLWGGDVRLMPVSSSEAPFSPVSFDDFGAGIGTAPSARRPRTILPQGGGILPVSDEVVIKEF